MQIVIDISEELYKSISKDKSNIGYMDMSDWQKIINIVKNGTPLPKHGRLIDADYLKNVTLLHNFHCNNKNIVPYSDRRGYRLRQREVDEAIINAQTIIEADKAERNK